jgi:hypothetical protein
VAFTGKGPISIRVETGDLFNPGSNNAYETPKWEYVRLEDGTDKLVGPAALTDDVVVRVRLQAGDVDTLAKGHGS